MEEGIVFDIARFSLNDGPGIRTNVFLKGCPLQCKWCHNPESQLVSPQLSYIDHRCVNCGGCINVCKQQSHYRNGSSHAVDFSACNACSDCINECTQSALTIIGKKATVSETIRLVEKDLIFYERSGGGLTISGGEPLSQINFTIALLQEAKKRGIATCVETCGFSSRENVTRILPLVDLFLFDFKDSDNVRHFENTGVKNELILNNLQFICESGAKVILRCPIIPGINDCDSHFKSIANLKNKFDSIIGVELMPYHDFGRAKAINVGKANVFKAYTPSNEMKESWLLKLKLYDCEKVTIA